MRKPRSIWIVLFVLLLAAAAGVLWLRKPTFSSTGASATDTVTAAASVANKPMALLASDVVQVRRGDLRQVLPLSGSLRAVKQASVKAQVGGLVRQVLVREGEAVKAGQVLVTMDASEYLARVAQARGALAAARGQLGIASKARDNNRILTEKGFISKNAFDNAVSQFDIARANVDSAVAALTVAQKSVSDATLRSPIAGLVGNRTIEPGEKVSPDVRLMEIVDLRRMEMDAAVPTSEIGRVAVGQEVRIDIDGVGMPIVGKVMRIDPSTQAGSRSIVVHVEIDNTQGSLRAGMFGEARLTLNRRDAVLTVPTSAIQHLDGKTMVYAVRDGMVQRLPVTLGITGTDDSGEVVEIIDGVTQGATILRNNLGNLIPGTRVIVERLAPSVLVPANAR